MPLIRSNHLEDLARQTAGRDQLGELLRRLVYCWLPNRVRGISFLAGDVNNFSGWDGWVHLGKAGSESVDHFSVWQLSAEASAPSKIKRDFKASLEAALPAGWSRSNTTYVAVTLRKLKDRDNLETQLRNTRGNGWADVRIIDAIGLEQWIEKCPAVEGWAGEEFGIGGIRFGESLSRRWSRWSEATVPPITRELMLAGRDTKVIEDGLRFENDRIFAIRTDSPEESIALIRAVIDALPSPARDRLVANSLVVSNDARADEYALQPFRDEMEPLTILVPPAVSYASRLAGAGHRVVMAFGRKDPQARAVLVKRALRSDFEKALTTSMKVAPADATAQARACGSSSSIWRVWNLLGTATPGDQTPAWARDNAVASLVIPAALIRSWDENCQGDKDIVAEFSGREYAKYRDSLQPYGICDDPLFDRAGSVFYIVAPAVAFTLLRPLITPSHLSALERLTKAVFGEIEKDVADIWNAPPDDSPRIKDKPKYSTWLRDGLAETLLGVAFLGQAPLSDALDRVGGGQEFVNRLIRELPGLGSDPRIIASLRDQLPYLAEAAPIPFVEALESLLQGDPVRLQPLFADRGFFGPTFQSGLLWALETLAWSSEYLPRVTMILGQLDDLDPGGNIGNRPINSLREIFLAWHHGTSASIEDRIVALRRLYDRHPNVAWKLLLKLLPHPSDTASPTQEPTWRDFGRSEMPELTNRSLAQSYRSYAELSLDLAEGDLKRQFDLIDAYPQFSDEYRKRLIDMLNASSTHGWAEELLVQTWNTLRKLVAHHRSFENAEWAMKDDDLRPLEELAAKYLPADAISRNKWVLDDQWPDTDFKADDFEGKERDIEKRRRNAVKDILAHDGWSGIYRLIRESKQPYVSAGILADVIDDDTALLAAFDVWAQERTPGQLSAMCSASRVRFHKKGANWTKLLIAHANSDHWPDEVLANALLDYPSVQETFNLVASLNADVERYFWEHCWFNTSQASPETKRFAAEKYILHARAADMLNMVGQNFSDLGVELVLRLIDETIKQLNEQRLPRDGNTFSYHLGNAFKWLRKQPSVNALDVARLEYPFLPLLTGPRHNGDETLTLHKLLSEEPDFFVQVLCDLYKPAIKPRELPVDETAKSKATAAWRLLESWKLVPGLTEVNSIDKEILNTWVTKARALAHEKDRADVGDQHIGKVFYHAPADPTNQRWPPIPILELLEKLESKQIERGFALECVNSRGVTSRAPLAGGDLERGLEAVWLQRARDLGTKWPRAKALFQLIAEDWKDQAKWHDEDAQKMRLRWS